MGRLVTLTMIMIGMMAMMHITGIISSSIWTIDNSSFFSSGFIKIAIWTALGALIAIGGISIGFLSGSSFNLVTSVASTAALAFAGTFIGYMIQVVNVAKESGNTWVAWIVYLIMIVLAGGYTISVFDWARGND